MTKKTLIFSLLSICLYTHSITAFSGHDDGTSCNISSHQAVMNSLNTFNQTLAYEAVLYETWKNGLELLQDELTVAQEIRNDIFESLHMVIDDLKECFHDETTTLVKTKKITSYEQHLLHQLAELKLETKSKIEYLNYLVKHLSEELSFLYNSYAEKKELDEQKSKELMKSLLTTCDHHEKMIRHRTEFLKAFTTFVDYVQQYLHTTTHEIERLEAHMCDFDEADTKEGE